MDGVIEYPIKFLYFGVWGPSKGLLGINHLKFNVIPGMADAYVNFATKYARFLPKSKVMAELSLNIGIDKVGIGLLNAWEFELFDKYVLPLPKEIFSAIMTTHDKEGLEKVTPEERASLLKTREEVVKRLKVHNITLDDFAFEIVPSEDGSMTEVRMVMDPEVEARLRQEILQKAESELFDPSKLKK